MSDKLEVCKSPIYGRGCFARVHFAARKKIASFTGELLRGRRRIIARLNAQREVKIIWVSDDCAIDSSVGGDATAFINHSCEPNAYMRVAPGEHVIFFALRDIEPGEEITMDYRNPLLPEVCRCGSPKCRSRTRRS